ncbi:hypothetical protein VW23_014340 [Devosia insulae DS-56]|uniref:Uncharacterized protein n=1 Tax=Devosia insulae DS-56 TaxID=1116389 RepID=A0A1E5XTD8_9HYPH|nr:hypothetical protein [Devosia insulae]OEO31852.1 hypothetical protein VW23_014340 [Devosia insulae DS-56]
MRVELHLILWVTAVVSISAVLFHGSAEVSQIPSMGSGAALEVAVLQDGSSGPMTASTDVDFPRSLPQIDEGARWLFAVAGPAEIEAPLPTEVASTPPVLKGIISSAGGLRAVFALTPQATDYVVAATGEEVGEYRIKDIAADRVLGVSAGGDEVTFNLRGAGEHP